MTGRDACSAGLWFAVLESGELWFATIGEAGACDNADDAEAVSRQSPIGEALTHCRTGDLTTVHTPDGPRVIEVLAADEERRAQAEEAVRLERQGDPAGAAARRFESAGEIRSAAVCYEAAGMDARAADL